jgi:hypothetical protein
VSSVGEKRKRDERIGDGRGKEIDGECASHGARWLLIGTESEPTTG